MVSVIAQQIEFWIFYRRQSMMNEDFDSTQLVELHARSGSRYLLCLFRLQAHNRAYSTSTG